MPISIVKTLSSNYKRRILQWRSQEVAITFVISMVVFKFVWAWVVPDLFPGAVAQGLISADLTWLAALKLAVLVGVLSGFYPALVDAFKLR